MCDGLGWDGLENMVFLCPLLSPLLLSRKDLRFLLNNGLMLFVFLVFVECAVGVMCTSLEHLEEFLGAGGNLLSIVQRNNKFVPEEIHFCDIDQSTGNEK